MDEVRGMERAPASRGGAFLRALRAAGLSMAPMLAGLGLACGNDGMPFNGFDDVRTTVEIRLQGGSGLRSVAMTVTYDPSSLEVLSVEPGEAPLATATCTHDIAPDRTTATCASAATFAAPLVAWRLETRHSEAVPAAAAMTSVTCDGTDAAGAPVAVTCRAID